MQTETQKKMPCNDRGKNATDASINQGLPATPET